MNSNKNSPFVVTYPVLYLVGGALLSQWHSGGKETALDKQECEQTYKTKSESTKVLSTGSLLWQYPVAFKGCISSFPWLVSPRKYQFQLLEALTATLMESQNKEQLLKVSAIIDLWGKIKARLPCPYFFNNPVLR